MRTRKQTNRQEKQSSGTLADISQDGVNKLLDRANPSGRTQSRVKTSSDQCVNTAHEVALDAETSGPSISGSMNWDMKVAKAIGRANPCSDQDGTDGSDWEDGSVPLPYSSINTQSDQVSPISIQFDDPTGSAKQKPSKRATAEEKEVAELVHKVHLLCLLARGRLIDKACNDPLIQGSLLSLLPSHLLNISEVAKLTADALAPLVSWFHNIFQVRRSSSEGVPFHSALAAALETREGTPEEVIALSVALFRALNLTTRFVSIMDVVPMKPELDKSWMLDSDVKVRKKDIFDASTLMVTGQNQGSTCSAKSSSSGKVLIHEASHSSTSEMVHVNSPMKMKDENFLAARDLKTSVPCTSETKDGSDDAKPSKRKGDLEFERQLEMALSATAVAVPEINPVSEIDNSQNSPSITFPCKRMKRIRTEESTPPSQGMSVAIGSRKVGAPLHWAEIYCSGENMTGKWVHVDVVNAIVDGEDKVEAAAASCKKSLRYVLAFAGNGVKDVTRRYCMKWYQISSKRVDSLWWGTVLAPLKELESGATGGIVHLAQHELNSSSPYAKVEQEKNQNDTCGQSGTDLPETGYNTNISGKRCEDESCIGGSSVATRSSLEDMELETRALTEPLPSNQQAYRNHKLYAIEKWLTKYQILHPKGPVLGLCSGQPVYPRSCVQILHTKERWLREGLQVRANELPAKVVKSSMKQGQGQRSLDGDTAQGTTYSGATVALYGKWQMEPLCLPSAVDGIVPKNERGQVDVWSEKCLPPGTMHLRLPRLVPVAKKLGIDFAPAMVGFEFRNGRSLPVFEGIVICSEFKDAILAAYAEEEARREEGQRQREERQALSRWYQLLSSMVTQQKLKNSYGHGSSSQTTTIDPPKSESSGCGESMGTSAANQANALDTASLGLVRRPSGDHDHLFLKEDESLDVKTYVRTKRCRCGFAIEVEEL